MQVDFVALEEATPGRGNGVRPDNTFCAVICMSLMWWFTAGWFAAPNHSGHSTFGMPGSWENRHDWFLSRESLASEDVMGDDTYQTMELFPTHEPPTAPTELSGARNFLAASVRHGSGQSNGNNATGNHSHDNGRVNHDHTHGGYGLEEELAAHWHTTTSTATSTATTTPKLACPPTHEDVDLNDISNMHCRVYGVHSEVCALYGPSDDATHFGDGGTGCADFAGLAGTTCDGKFQKKGACGLCLYGTDGTGCWHAVKGSKGGRGGKKIPCHICLDRPGFCDDWRTIQCRIRHQWKHAHGGGSLVNPASLVNVLTLVLAAMNLIAYATFPASSLVIHDITAPFAEALDTIRLVIAAFYFTYEAIIMIVAFYQMEAAILHNMFQSADLAGTMYSVFLAGHCITVALVLVDIFFCTFSGRLQQWWAHISGGLQERILWGVVAVAHTYMLYVWAAAA